MMETLCWKCKEQLETVRINRLKVTDYTLGFLHCHHEPKEKPKCWCEQSDIKIYFDIVRCLERLSNMPAKYCPECGRKL